MPMIALALAVAIPTAQAASIIPCKANQLRLSVDGKGGDFNGMSHAGVELSIRNIGGDCSLPGLPMIEFHDARGRVLPASRQAPVGMHPGPVILPVRIASGHRAVTDIRWVSGPVFDHSRRIQVATISLRISKTLVRAPMTAVLYGEAGKSVQFEQPPLHAAEGMAAG